jgi:hypothetical protein
VYVEAEITHGGDEDETIDIVALMVGRVEGVASLGEDVSRSSAVHHLME